MAEVVRCAAPLAGAGAGVLAAGAAAVPVLRTTVGAVVTSAGLVVLVVTVSSEARLDFALSCCSLCLEVATAPRAFSIGRPRAPRLEAEPWPVAVPAVPPGFLTGEAGAWGVLGARRAEA